MQMMVNVPDSLPLDYVMSEIKKFEDRLKKFSEYIEKNNLQHIEPDKLEEILQQFETELNNS